MTLPFIKELPIPRFDKDNNLHQRIFQNSARLICTTDEYTKLREEVDESQFVTDVDERITLIAQINACAAKIYDLNYEELEFVLKNFNL